MCMTNNHEIHIHLSKDLVSNKQRPETKHKFVLVVTCCIIHLYIRIGGKGVPESFCSKGGGKDDSQASSPCNKAHTKEWILQFETTLDLRTLAGAPNLEVVLRMIQLYSLHHVDINPICSAHTSHHHVHEPTCQSQREATSLIHPSALSYERTQRMQSLHGPFCGNALIREALGAIPN